MNRTTPDRVPISRPEGQEPGRTDLLIIGGGINGAGIARDAAGRGLGVVLVEQDDLAAATSSASTKLIHGGLRYLELFELRLVRESLIERERLLEIAPHLIRPMQFVLPHVKELRPRWQMRLGLFLYDHLGGRRHLPASRSLRLNGTAFGAILKPALRRGFAYSDCCVDDSRLVVLNALDAAERGARIMTRTRFVSARRSGAHWHVQLADTISGRLLSLEARALVNAAGPWVEQVLDAIPDVRASGRLRLVKGSHIVLASLYEGTHAYVLQNPDGRIVFAIPFEDRFTLVGTTDVPVEGVSARPTIDAEEVDYLCATINRYFRRQITPADVRWSYAGIRALSDDDELDASKVTRDYRLELSGERGEPPLLSVFGGKITTYRKLAETALRKLQPWIGGGDREWTAREALPGGDIPHGDLQAFLADVARRWPFLPASSAWRLARAYGTRIERVLGAARSWADLGGDLGVGLSRAEIAYLQTHEWARSAEDILWRRTKVGLHMSPSQRDQVREALEPVPAALREDA